MSSPRCACRDGERTQGAGLDVAASRDDQGVDAMSPAAHHVLIAGPLPR